jgi:hypothetical protein
MPASRILIWPLLIGLSLFTGKLHAKDMADGRLLECKTNSGTTATSWQIRLDGSSKQAVVDEKAFAAAYTPSHARILLSTAGPALFIGRTSGRLVVSNTEGRTLGVGQCTPLMEI